MVCDGGDDFFDDLMVFVMVECGVFVCGVDWYKVVVVFCDMLFD